jgi:hypothetical protein
MSEDKMPDHLRPMPPEGRTYDRPPIPAGPPTFKGKVDPEIDEIDPKKWPTSWANRPDPVMQRLMERTDGPPELLPEGSTKGIPELGTTRHEKDPIAYVKIGSRSGETAYFITEYDPVRKTAYGVIDGPGGRRFEQFSVTDLQKRRDLTGLPMERDFSWKPQPVSMIRCEGRSLGRDLGRGR